VDSAKFAAANSRQKDRWRWEFAAANLPGHPPPRSPNQTTRRPAYPAFGASGGRRISAIELSGGPDDRHRHLREVAIMRSR
jgi:hypothetical protein